MKELISKIMLTCKKATFFSSVRNFKKLNITQRFQLMLHLMACPFCREFDRQSRLIDKGIEKAYKTNHLSGEDHLSETKKSEIKKNVNQNL